MNLDYELMLTKSRSRRSFEYDIWLKTRSPHYLMKVSFRCSSSRVICGNIYHSLRRLSSAFFQALADVIAGNFELRVVTKLAILDTSYVNKHCELHREIVASV